MLPFTLLPSGGSDQAQSTGRQQEDDAEATRETNGRPLPALTRSLARTTDVWMAMLPSLGVENAQSASWRLLLLHFRLS